MTGWRKIPLLGLGLLLVCSFTFAGGKKDSKKREEIPPTPAVQTPAAVAETSSKDGLGNVVDGQTVEVWGKIRLVGSEPFPELVITDDSGNDWYIDEESREAVQAYEQRRVRLSAIVRLKSLTLANGTALPERRILKAVTVLD